MSLTTRIHQRGEDPGPCRCDICANTRLPQSASVGSLSERLARPAEPFVPEWRKRMTPKDLTRAA